MLVLSLAIELTICRRLAVQLRHGWSCCVENERDEGDLEPKRRFWRPRVGKRQGCVRIDRGRRRGHTDGARDRVCRRHTWRRYRWRSHEGYGCARERARRT